LKERERERDYNFKCFFFKNSKSLCDELNLTLVSLMEKFNELGKFDYKQKKLEERMNELQNKILNLTELTKETNEITQTNVNNITDVIQYVR
jgi:uncharacterized protein (UPF0305 family)